MKIRILSATVCDGRMVDTGAVVETNKDTAQFLVGMKKAEYYVFTAPPVERAMLKPPTRKATVKR